MTANLTLNQVGLPAGTTNEARDDGLDTGAVMSWTASGFVSTFRMELLWTAQHPSPDTTAEASFALSGPATYSATPTAARYGTYLVRLITDEGTADEDEITLGFAVLSSPTALRIPAPQERGDPNASLVLATPAQKRLSWFNKPELTGPFSGAGGSWAPWWRPHADMIHEFNTTTSGVPPSRQINTTAPLAGGGDLSADRTLSITAATTVAAGSMSAADKLKLDGIQNAIVFVAVGGTTKTPALSDAYTTQEATNAAGLAFTIPTAASVAYEVGTVISLIQEGAGQITIDDTAIVGAGGVLNTSGGEKKSRVQWSEIFLKKQAVNTWHMTGDKAV